MGFMKNYVVNTRKPEGFLGKMMVEGMNKGHARMASWGFKTLPALSPLEIADLGCGGGKNADELLKAYPKARVTAVDYSPVSVAKAEKVNKKAIEEGRCRILQGDVSSLSLESDSFQLVTAFETVYFWPGPLKSFKEVYRILEKGGTFLISNECDGKGKNDEMWLSMIEGMRIYTDEEMKNYLTEAGFVNIKINHNEEKHWVSYVCKKP